jgi:hypothetical protein
VGSLYAPSFSRSIAAAGFSHRWISMDTRPSAQCLNLRGTITWMPSAFFVS